MKSIRQEHEIAEIAGIPVDAGEECDASQIVIIKIFHTAADYLIAARNDKLNHVSRAHFLTH